MDSIFSELPRDLRFVIYEKAMHAAYKEYFSDQVLPKIHDGSPAGHFILVQGSNQNNETVLILRHHYEDMQFIDRALRIRSNGECDLTVFENCSRHSGRTKFNRSGIVVVYEGPQAVPFFSDPTRAEDLVPIPTVYNWDGNDTV